MLSVYKNSVRNQAPNLFIVTNKLSICWGRLTDCKGFGLIKFDIQSEQPKGSILVIYNKVLRPRSSIELNYTQFK